MTVRDSQCVNRLRVREKNGRCRFKRTRRSTRYRRDGVALNLIASSMRRDRRKCEEAAKGKTGRRCGREEQGAPTILSLRNTYIVSRSARRLGTYYRTTHLKRKIVEKEPGQPLKISDNKIENLIQL